MLSQSYCKGYESHGLGKNSTCIRRNATTQPVWLSAESLNLRCPSNFQEITQKASRGSGGVAVGFVDFKQAFPSVSHSAIRAALSAFHIPENLKKLILALYCDLKSFVRTPYGDTEAFEFEMVHFKATYLPPRFLSWCWTVFCVQQ